MEELIQNIHSWAAMGLRDETAKQSFGWCTYEAHAILVTNIGLSEFAKLAHVQVS